MKIALLIRRYITTGGAERYAVEVARRLARVHEVHVFAQQWDHRAGGDDLASRSPPLQPAALFESMVVFLADRQDDARL